MRSAAAAVLGELIPELEYSAPILLDRLDRGLPLVEPTVSADLGFDTGVIDGRLLELVRLLAPHVVAAIDSEMFGVVRSRLLRQRAGQELRAALARPENVKWRHRVETIAGALSGFAGVPVAPSEVVEAIVAALRRLAQHSP